MRIIIFIFRFSETKRNILEGWDGDGKRINAGSDQKKSEEVSKKDLRELCNLSNNRFGNFWLFV